jgi:hypothetical protein
MLSETNAGCQIPAARDWQKKTQSGRTALNPHQRRRVEETPLGSIKHVSTRLEIIIRKDSAQIKHFLCIALQMF